MAPGRAVKWSSRRRARWQASFGGRHDATALLDPGMVHDSNSQLVTVTNPQGLHARPAHALVILASRYKAHIELVRDGECADAKSILAIMTLAAEQGTQLTIKATGEDAGEAIAALTQLFAEGFGEQQDPPAENESSTSGRGRC
jgi:phosphotransferase system HPr (HPr) family protein